MNGSQPDLIFHRAFNAVGPGKMWLSQDSYLPLFGTPDSLATEVKISQWTQAEGLRCVLLFPLHDRSACADLLMNYCPTSSGFMSFYTHRQPRCLFLCMNNCCRCQPGTSSAHASPINVCFLDTERTLAKRCV